MSFTMHGVAVSGGIAVGYARLVSHAQLEVAHYLIEQQEVAAEAERFDAAIGATRAELSALRGVIPASAPAEFDAFLNLHLMILDDAMSSWALVILAVDLTVAIRRLTARSCAPIRLRFLVLRRRHVLGDAVLGAGFQLFEPPARLGDADHGKRQFVALRLGVKGREDFLIR